MNWINKRVITPLGLGVVKDRDYDGELLIELDDGEGVTFYPSAVKLETLESDRTRSRIMYLSTTLTGDRIQAELENMGVTINITSDEVRITSTHLTTVTVNGTQVIIKRQEDV
jgi:hypothetical protein